MNPKKTTKNAETQALNMTDVIARLSSLREDYLRELENVSVTHEKELEPKFQNMKSYQEMITNHFVEYASIRLKMKYSYAVPPCGGNCELNYCDENGCTERKRVLVEPTDLPKKSKVKTIKKGTSISIVTVITEDTKEPEMKGLKMISFQKGESVSMWEFVPEFIDLCEDGNATRINGSYIKLTKDVVVEL